MNASVNKAEKEDVHTTAVEEEKTNRLQEVAVAIIFLILKHNAYPKTLIFPITYRFLCTRG